MAFEHDGAHKWTKNPPQQVAQSAIAISNMDGQGPPELRVGLSILDNEGNNQFMAPYPGQNVPVGVAVDLDGDDDQEFIVGPRAYHHDGSQYYFNPQVDGFNFGFMEVADLDEDGLPEIFVHNGDLMFILEHDGTTKVQLDGDKHHSSPAAIHDMDGDGLPDIALNSKNRYRVFDGNLVEAWSKLVQDGSGYASGTGFDFLGDAEAEAMYADQNKMYAFDGTGQSILETPRSSWTQFEYPVVADVDNDGSAEVVVVSNKGNMGQSSPTVQVIRDAEDRWIQARRIWNQWTYHVTNVREDGTIPMVETPHWEALNTFRTNAQIKGGSVCEPEG